MKHLKIISNGKIIFDGEIKNCNECPCWNDGAHEYATKCILYGRITESFLFVDDDGEGIDAACPLKDKV